MNPLIPIYLTAEDIETFKKFQKHYALIGLLESIGAFEVRSGSVTVHFDKMGKIGSVDKNVHYRPSGLMVDVV